MNRERRIARSRKGGFAAAASRTAEERSESARNAVQARWDRLTTEQRSEELRQAWRVRRANQRRAKKAPIAA